MLRSRGRQAARVLMLARRGKQQHAAVNARPLSDFMPKSSSQSATVDATPPPYVSSPLLHGDGRSVYIETYGCQMNVSDTEIVHSILASAGYTRSPSLDHADVVLVNTCAIRDGAEQRAALLSRLLVLCNPSNPTGAVHGLSHAPLLPHVQN